TVPPFTPTPTQLSFSSPSPTWRPNPENKATAAAARRHKLTTASANGNRLNTSWANSASIAPSSMVERYSRVVFPCQITRLRQPAIFTAVALIPLSPCLIFGWGPFPQPGIAGGAVAVIVYYAVGTIVFASYLWAGRSVVRLSLQNAHLRWPLFRDILRVGTVAALITVQTNLTIAIVTGLVGRFGPAAIAGYGTGARLEYLLVPLVFGLGAPLVALVGTNLSAGQHDRAVRAA